ncbi:hypothetical protein JR316_0013005 [Psilocybe cubensis]|uniref:DUF6535 domain-containing protein n=2 Tax=Psilocybe cubensis TaxID=181762 RepID=A0A8H7XRS1_PSICU|nr:hypothetical protein JR316_0013005 [Psilocybe cubensis]KAH9474543.1 hypothetical protein JR316_0013005 [Psilocybe cubensis]
MSMTSVDNTACTQDHSGSSELPDNLDKVPEEANPALPKVWSIEDPFQYAPPKRDGEPWSLLLEPLLKNEKLRCDAWKDEVQNLLIFAGLFSAVVTTFLVESYKDLQPDPNDTVITLLAHIAARLDNDTVITKTSLSSNDPFVPAASTVRVNVFWFISLVLSLTTVLVGIISLQWLREYQSYSNLSNPREMYAIFHMRKDGLDRWRVDRVFTAMPLLLQSALVLFLGGLIDFLHAFSERWSVVIPVAAVIGISLLFLVVTTILPALQTMSLFVIPTSWPDPPSQCPYKSPQSHAVRRICVYLYDIHFHLKRLWRLSSIPSMISRLCRILFGSAVKHRFSFPSKFRSQVTYSSWSRSWSGFDEKWVLIRDMYMRHSLGNWNKDFGHFDIIGWELDEQLPLFDIVVGLNRQKWQGNVSDVVYHCFSDISQRVLSLLTDTSRYSPRERLRQNDYLYNILSRRGGVSVTRFFDTDACFSDVEKGELSSAKALSCALHQQNLAIFTDWSSGVLQRHQKELALRLFGYFYQKPHKLRLTDTKLKAPKCISFQHFSYYHLIADRDQDMRDKDTFEALSWQFANLTFAIFKEACKDFDPHSLVHNSLAQEHGLWFFLDVAGYMASRTLSPSISFSINCQNEPSAVVLAMKEMIRNTFSYIRSKLEMEMSTWKDNQAKPSLLFYVTVCYILQLIDPLAKEETFASLRDTVLQYKKCTIDIGIIDAVLERRLSVDQGATSDRFGAYYSCPGLPFSSLWWRTFEGKHSEDLIYNPTPYVEEDSQPADVSK